MSEHIVDITMDNAQSMLIEESMQRLVVVDFWADWCEPCNNLMPVLEKLAIEYGGQFLLAKVNADEQNMISSQFGVRSLPTVMLIKDGQPIDGFTGAQTESSVREVLEKHLPKAWDLQLIEARGLLAEDKTQEAAVLLKQAYESSNQQADIAFEYARTLIVTKRLDDAEAVLASIKMVDQGGEYKQLQAQLELAREAGKSPELEALETQHRESPDDQALALQLATQYSQNEYFKEALELLYPMIRANLACLDGEAKKVFMDILAVLDKADPLAAEYQRKLYTLLY